MNPTDIANNAIEGAKQYDGSIYITTIIVVGILLLLFMYVWYIQIPNMTANRENSKKLVEAMATVVLVTGSTHKTVEVTHDDITKLDFRTERLMLAKRLECRVLDKIARKNGLDITADLAEIRGLCTEQNKQVTEAWVADKEEENA